MTWHSLRLTSLGVIAEAELEFEPGFTAITGETGAGKTMLVTAIAMLRGQRADPASVRFGADRAHVEATVGINRSNADLVERIGAAGGAVDDDELIIGRIVASAGRSRAVVGGATVPASLLAEITDQLVAVHGQSDQQRLLRPVEQREALDRFAGEPLAELFSNYRPAFERLRWVERHIDELNTHGAERLRELDLLQHGLNEIELVAPQPGEDSDLRAEEQRLAHAESLAGGAMGAYGQLSEGDHSVGHLLAAAQSELDHVADHDKELDALAERLRSTTLEIADIASELHVYGTSVEVDPGRLAATQERRARLTALQRRYGPTVEAVLAWADQAAERALTLSKDDTAIVELEHERSELRTLVDRLAAQISEMRRNAAEQLSSLILPELTALAMPSARLAISVTSSPATIHGADDVEFLFSANSGSAPQTLAKSASGGELSRVMLALEVVLADVGSVPTMIFDEVDSGIGGKTAVEVGRRLAKLALSTQVIAVTHLPQVAAFADDHFVVEKSDDGAVTSSSVTRVSADTRVDELAKMLAGLEGSASARQHARELLELAQR